MYVSCLLFSVALCQFCCPCQSENFCDVCMSTQSHFIESVRSRSFDVTIRNASLDDGDVIMMMTAVMVLMK